VKLDKDLVKQKPSKYVGCDSAPEFSFFYDRMKKKELKFYESRTTLEKHYTKVS